MKIQAIIDDLKKSWNNGVYVDLPEFRSNERVYIHRSGKMSHVKSNVDGSLWVIPTELTSYEQTDTRWQVNPLNRNKLPVNFKSGW